MFRIIATLISHRTVRCASYTLTIVPREFLDPLILKQVSVAYMLHIMSSYFTLPLVSLLDSIRIRKTCLEPNEIERVVVIISPSREISPTIFIYLLYACYCQRSFKILHWGHGSTFMNFLELYIPYMYYSRNIENLFFIISNIAIRCDKKKKNKQ